MFYTIHYKNECLLVDRLDPTSAERSFRSSVGDFTLRLLDGERVSMEAHDGHHELRTGSEVVHGERVITFLGPRLPREVCKFGNVGWILPLNEFRRTLNPTEGCDA